MSPGRINRELGGKERYCTCAKTSNTRGIEGGGTIEDSIVGTYAF